MVAPFKMCLNQQMNRGYTHKVCKTSLLFYEGIKVYGKQLCHFLLTSGLTLYIYQSSFVEKVLTKRE